MSEQNQSPVPGSQSPPPQRGRVAGIDYGTVRIGVAIGDLEVSMASPFETYNRRDKESDARYFKSLAEEERLVRWVVGLPVHLSGEESQKSFEARQFGKLLHEWTGLPVHYYDERFTSAYADSILQTANLTRDQRKARIDQLAAQIMLTAYLESGAENCDNPGGLDG